MNNKVINLCDPATEKAVFEERCRQIAADNLKKEMKLACHNMMCPYFKKSAKCYIEKAISNCTEKKDYVDDVTGCYGYKLWDKLDDETKKAIFIDLKK